MLNLSKNPRQLSPQSAQTWRGFWRGTYQFPRQSYPLYLPKMPLNQHSGFNLHVPFIPTQLQAIAVLELIVEY